MCKEVKDDERIELTLNAGDKLIEVGQKLKDSTKDSTAVQRPEVPEPIR